MSDQVHPSARAIRVIRDSSPAPNHLPRFLQLGLTAPVAVPIGCRASTADHFESPLRGQQSELPA
jgi:hypothetical protein